MLRDSEAPALNSSGNLAPVATIIVHPGEPFILKTVSQASGGEQITRLPIFRVHQAVKAVSKSDEHYSRLTQAAWNTIMNQRLGIKQLEGLHEDTNPGLFKAINEAQEELGTQIAKGEPVIVLASPAEAMDLLKVGYQNHIPLETASGSHQAYDMAGMQTLNQQPFYKEDVTTGWRPHLGSLRALDSAKHIINHIPKWCRCLLCRNPCNNKNECPYDFRKGIDTFMSAILIGICQAFPSLHICQRLPHLFNVWRHHQ